MSEVINEINKITTNSSLNIEYINMTTLLFSDRVLSPKVDYTIADNMLILKNQPYTSLNLFQFADTSTYYEFFIDLKSSNTTISGKDRYGNSLSNLSNTLLVFVNGYKLSPWEYTINSSNDTITINTSYSEKNISTVIIYNSENMVYEGNPIDDFSWDSEFNQFYLKDYTVERYIFFKNGELLDPKEIQKVSDYVRLNIKINKDTDIIEYYRMTRNCSSLTFTPANGYLTYGPKDDKGILIQNPYNCIATFDYITRVAIDDIRTGFFIHEVDNDGCLMIVDDDFETCSVKCLIIRKFNKTVLSSTDYFLTVPDAPSILKYVSQYDLNGTLFKELLASFQKVLLNETYDSIQRLKNIRNINKVDSSNVSALINFLGLKINVTGLTLAKKHHLVEELRTFYNVVGTRASYNFYNAIKNEGKILNIEQLFTPIKSTKTKEIVESIPTFFPKQWGELLSVVETISQTENRNSHVYVWSLRFENGVLPVILREDQVYPNFDFSLFEYYPESSINSAVYNTLSQNWVNATGDDNEDKDYVSWKYKDNETDLYYYLYENKAKELKNNWWKWSTKKNVITSETVYKHYIYSVGEEGDLPASYGPFKKAICTSTLNESRTDHVYILSLHFENGTLPIKVYRNQNKLDLNLDYFTTNTNPSINSMVYYSKERKWINSIAKDGSSAMLWYDENGNGKRSLGYIAATAMRWNDGHNTVLSDALTYKKQDDKLIIYKWGNKFAELRLTGEDLKWDIPYTLGSFKTFKCTTAVNENRDTWVYILSLRFENGMVPVIVRRNSDKIEFNKDYIDFIVDDRINSAAWIPSFNKWINCIAWDTDDLLQWDTIDGANADNMAYPTATAWGWPDRHGTPTVYSDRLSCTLEGNLLKIYQNGSYIGSLKIQSIPMVYSSIYLINEEPGATAYNSNYEKLGTVTDCDFNTCIFEEKIYRKAPGNLHYPNIEERTFYKYTNGEAVEGGYCYDDSNETNPLQYINPTKTTFQLIESEESSYIEESGESKLVTYTVIEKNSTNEYIPGIETIFTHKFRFEIQDGVFTARDSRTNKQLGSWIFYVEPEEESGYDEDDEEVVDPVNRYVTFRTAEELGAITKQRYETETTDFGAVSESSVNAVNFTNTPRYEGVLKYIGYPPMLQGVIDRYHPTEDYPVLKEDKIILSLIVNTSVKRANDEIYEDQEESGYYIEEDIAEISVTPNNLIANLYDPDNERILPVIYNKETNASTFLLRKAGNYHYEIVDGDGNVLISETLQEDNHTNYTTLPSVNDYVTNPKIGPNTPDIDCGYLTDNPVDFYDFGSVSEQIPGHWVSWYEWDRPKGWYPTNHVDVSVDLPVEISYENFMNIFKDTFYEMASAVLYIHQITQLYIFGDPDNDGSTKIQPMSLITTQTYNTEEQCFTNDYHLPIYKNVIANDPIKLVDNVFSNPIYEFIDNNKLKVTINLRKNYGRDEELYKETGEEKDIEWTDSYVAYFPCKQLEYTDWTSEQVNENQSTSDEISLDSNSLPKYTVTCTLSENGKTWVYAIVINYEDREEGYIVENPGKNTEKVINVINTTSLKTFQTVINGEVQNVRPNSLFYIPTDDSRTNGQWCLAYVTAEENGDTIGYSDGDTVRNTDGDIIGHNTSIYFVLNEDDYVIGYVINDIAYDINGIIIGYSDENDIKNGDGVIIGHKGDKRDLVIGNSNELLGIQLDEQLKLIINNNEILGYQGNEVKIAVDADHKFLGNVDYNNNLRNIETNSIIGYVDHNGIAYNQNNNIIGYKENAVLTINKNNNTIASVTKIKTGSEDTYYYSDKNNKTGYVNDEGKIVTKSNEIIGSITNKGMLYNKNNILIGNCIDDWIKFKENDKSEIIFYEVYNDVISYTNLDKVISDDNEIIARIDGYNNILNANNQIIGYKGDEAIIAIDDTNESNGNITFIGIVDENKNVINENKEIIGQALEDGTVVDLDGSVIGYTESGSIALNNEKELIGYVTNNIAYNKNCEEIGTITEKGTIFNFNGEMIGYVKHIENEEDLPVDFQDNVIGEIITDETVYDETGNVFGNVRTLYKVSNEQSSKFKWKIFDSSDIRNETGKEYSVDDAFVLQWNRGRFNEVIVDSKSEIQKNSLNNKSLYIFVDVNKELYHKLNKDFTIDNDSSYEQLYSYEHNNIVWSCVLKKYTITNNVTLKSGTKTNATTLLLPANIKFQDKNNNLQYIPENINYNFELVEGIVKQYKTEEIFPSVYTTYYKYTNKLMSQLNNSRFYFNTYGTISTSNEVVIDNVDYVVLKYRWLSGQDLDSWTYITNMTGDIASSINGIKVGWDQSTYVPNSNDYILYWGGDNTGTGEENILLDIKKLKGIYSQYTPDILNIEMYACWYKTTSQTQPEIEVTGYKGGTMIKNGKQFINNGGTMVAQQTIRALNMDTTTLHNYRSVANVKYDKNQDNIVLSITDSYTQITPDLNEVASKLGIVYNVDWSNYNGEQKGYKRASNNQNYATEKTVADVWKYINKDSYVFNGNSSAYKYLSDVGGVQENAYCGLWTDSIGGPNSEGTYWAISPACELCASSANFLRGTSLRSYIYNNNGQVVYFTVYKVNNTNSTFVLLMGEGKYPKPNSYSNLPDELNTLSTNIERIVGPIAWEMIYNGVSPTNMSNEQAINFLKSNGHALDNPIVINNENCISISTHA